TPTHHRETLTITHVSSSLPPVSFLTAPPPPDFYTLSLHDALPIWLLENSEVFSLAANGPGMVVRSRLATVRCRQVALCTNARRLDRKSTRLNSSHLVISYAVFCLKKKTCPRSPARVCYHRARQAVS